MEACWTAVESPHFVSQAASDPISQRWYSNLLGRRVFLFRFVLLRPNLGLPECITHLSHVGTQCCSQLVDGFN
jgi:hypothetical protein